MTKSFSTLRNVQRIDLVRDAPLAGPLAIFIEPTNVCNFRCQYCPESLPNYYELSGGRSHLTVKAFDHICAQLQHFPKIKSLNFYMMGEPFVNKDLTTFVSMAKNRDVAEKVIVTSNGTLLTEERARQVLDSGLDYIRFSIYGVDQARHARVTNSPIPLDRIKDNIGRLKRLRDQRGASSPFIVVKMIDPHDEATRQRFRADFGDLGDECMIEPTMDWTSSTEDNFSNMPREDMLAQSAFSYRKQVCPFPFYTLVIHSDLQVSVCCVDWSKKAVVGDLKSQTLHQIWMGDALHEFQLTHLRRQAESIEVCKDCTFYLTAPDNMDALSADEYARRIAKP